MLYGVWTKSKKDGEGKLERVLTESRIALDQELSCKDLASSLVEFEAATEAEYRQKEAAWRKRTGLDSYSGFNELPH